MSIEHEDSTDFNQNELLNARLQQLGADPSTAVEGQIWYRSDTHRPSVETDAGAEPLAYLSDIGGLIEQLEFDTTPSTTLTAEGQAQWNPDDHTLDIRLSDGVTLQTGQEIVVPCVNKTGSPIANGAVVMLIGAQGQRTEIALADADSYFGSQATLGIATQNIANNAVGFVTTLGLVRDIDTHLWADGTAVYLSQTAGELTSTIPPKGVRAVFVGIVVKGLSAGAGSIFVTIKDTQFLGESCDVDIPSPVEGDVPYRNASGVYAPFNLKSVATATKDITGWEANHLITETYNGTNRTVTLTTTEPTLRYWFNNIVTDLGTNTWTSTAHADEVGTWYLYSTDGTTFSWFKNTVWNFYNIMVHTVRYTSATKYISIREVHGLMPWTDHRYAHYNSGTIRLNGLPTEGIVGGYVVGSSTTADRRPSCSLINLLDEDLPTLVDAMVDGGPYSHLWITGATSSDFSVANESEIIFMSGTIPQYTTTAGVRTNVSSNSYANCWLVAIPATADTIGQNMRWVWLQPQKEHANLTLAQAETWASLAKGDLFGTVSEFLPVAQVTIKRESTNFSIAATPLIITGSRNGGGATSSGGAITTLQQAYEVSSEPEITLNATRGALSIKSYSGGDATNSLEIVEDGGTTTASITGAGKLTASSANITGLTASQIVATDASKNLQTLAVATYPSLAELAYVKGVTSAIQTQLNGKSDDSEVVHKAGQSDISGALSSTSYFESVRASGSALVGRVTGDTGDRIQVRVNGDIYLGNGAGGQLALLSQAELTYLDGVTSAIQTQINGKASLSGATFTGRITAPSITLGAADLASTIDLKASLSGAIFTGNLTAGLSFTSDGTSTLTGNVTTGGSNVDSGYQSWSSGTISASVTNVISPAGSGTYTMTLPALILGKRINIHNASPSVVTVARDGTSTILNGTSGGATSVTIPAYTAASFIALGYGKWAMFKSV